MDSTVKLFSGYIDHVLGIPVAPFEWDGEDKLPLYLRERYSLFQVNILNAQCILAKWSGYHDDAPAVIEKHFQQIAVRTKSNVILLKDSIKAYDRQRLIQRKIPFVIPYNQMYLPFLGVDLRERMLREQLNVAKLSNSAQYFILCAIARKSDEEMTPSKASELLGFSRMTMTRVFQELESVGIGRQEKRGKSRYIRFGDDREHIFRKAMPYLKSPVVRKLYARMIDPNAELPEALKVAGESALAGRTEIEEPRVPVFAVYNREWGVIRDLFLELPYAENGSILIEVWSHPVPMDSERRGVSDAALFLSLMDEADERLHKEQGHKEAFKRYF